MAAVKAVRTHASSPHLGMDTTARDIRAVLRAADAAYFDDLGACESELQAEAVPYPIVALEEPFAGGIRAGWGRAGDEVRRALRRSWQTLSAVGSVRVHFKDPGDDALEFALLGEEILIPEESVAGYVETRIPPLRHVLSEARRELCRDLIAEGAREGMTTQQTMAHLRTEGFGRSAAHAENIARTESATLYNHGTLARYRASSVVQGVRIEAVGDNRTCPRCMFMDGREFRCDDVDGVMPPLHFQCRCVIIPILFNEEVEFESAAAVLGEGGVDRGPLVGFGTVDTSAMPPPQDIRDFLKPLSESDEAEMREWVERVREKFDL